MRTTDFGAMRKLANDLVSFVAQKDRDYASSWKRRGGVGAYMMLCRKFDRIETLVKAHGYDIFAALRENSGGIHDDLIDAVGYLLLILEEAQGQAASPPPTSDYERASPRFTHDQNFLCEGGWGDGTNLYTCRFCKTQVRSTGLAGAAQEHGECPARGGPALV